MSAPAPTTDHPASRFRDLVAAEWIKLRSQRSTYWLLALAGLAIVALNVNDALADHRLLQNVIVDDNTDYVPRALASAFTMNASLVLSLVAGSLGAGIVVSELSSGLIRSTFVAVPSRRVVMAAKAAVVTSVLVLFGALVSSVSFWATQTILDDVGIGASISDPGAWRVVVASTLLAPIGALVGMAIGAVVRHTATTMVATLSALIVLPLLLDERYQLAAIVRHALVLPAWERLTDLNPWTNSAHPATVAGSWVVFVGWTLAAGIVAVTALHHRDV
jgi:ABC-2 type transport system permease protein